MRRRLWPLVALLPVIAIPSIVINGDDRAFIIGLLVYAIGAAVWLGLTLLEDDRRRVVTLGALGGLFFAYLLIPVFNAAAWPPLGIGDSSAGRAIVIFSFFFVAVVVGGGVGFLRPLSLPMARSDEEKKEQNTPLDIIKICDTSVLIDGRIAEMAEAGFIDGTLVIPQFVLRELQGIADSSEQLRRNRGRRGLGVVEKLQAIKGIRVEIPIIDYADEREVDHKLIRLATDLGASLFTNDFNLNKVARVRSIRVLNLNDLINALKTILLPGEEITLVMTRAGKEQGQGVAYLDDGTMVVVDGGGNYVGKTVKVVVTNIHQTTAGRMIFTRFEEVAKKGAHDAAHA
jgi:uncharacterized protein YacL